jgi:hypothetical protein
VGFCSTNVGAKGGTKGKEGRRRREGGGGGGGDKAEVRKEINVGRKEEKEGQGRNEGKGGRKEVQVTGTHI